MKGLLKLLGAILLIAGVGGGLYVLSGIENYDHVKFMFEFSTSISDYLLYGSKMIENQSRIIIGVSSIISGLISGFVLLAIGTILENQEKLIKLVATKPDTISEQPIPEQKKALEGTESV